MLHDKPLIDAFGRVHDSLRISITDRCNIRCFYCMPEHDATFMPKSRLLTYEEITRLARLLIRRGGVRDIRITGGEPLVRRDCHVLIRRLASIDGLDDLSMTTNGILLAEHATRLRDAGLRRLNISLDTLDDATLERIARRRGVDRIVEGIDAAIDAGFDSIKLNSLAIAGISDGQLVDLVRFASDRRVAIRFIEFMPLDADRAWTKDDVLTGDRVLEILRRHFGLIRPMARESPSAPAESFEVRVDGTKTRLGIIRSVTRPFCDDCNRLRLTADGSIRNCLFATSETPLRDALRQGVDDNGLIDLVLESVRDKRAAHGIGESEFASPERPMYSIGG
ncbi:MAG: GTP 3',8-cyclase MoaA [Planctomycetota bacterium]